MYSRDYKFNIQPENTRVSDSSVLFDEGINWMKRGTGLQIDLAVVEMLARVWLAEKNNRYD